MARLNFAIKMLFSRFDKKRSLCPYCSSKSSIILERKKLIIQARKCIYCGLIYRWPTDNERDNLKYYEDIYMNSSGRSTPDLPEQEFIKNIVENHEFSKKYDKSWRIKFLKRNVGENGKMLDFGCSWGISTYQYNQSGYETVGFEIDSNRAKFGIKNLNVVIASNWDQLNLNDKFDIIVADHSLEHVPNLKNVLDSFVKYSRSGTKLVIFVPNCSSKIARINGTKWGPFIGEAHTIAYTMDWFRKNLPLHGYNPVFYDNKNEHLKDYEYLYDGEEIALVASKF